MYAYFESNIQVFFIILEITGPGRELYWVKFWSDFGHFRFESFIGGTDYIDSNCYLPTNYSINCSQETNEDKCRLVILFLCFDVNNNAEEHYNLTHLRPDPSMESHSFE